MVLMLLSRADWEQLRFNHGIITISIKNYSKDITPPPKKRYYSHFSEEDRLQTEQYVAFRWEKEQSCRVLWEEYKPS